MNYWLAQLLSAFAAGYGGQVLAARRSNDRDGGWIQILVFVILAIFYAVGSIVKAKANKTALKEEKQIPRKPARKPPRRPTGPIPRGQRRLQVAKPQVQPPRRKVARPATARSAVTSPQPTGRRLPTKAEEAIKLAPLEPLEVSEVAVLEPQVQPKLGEIPEFTTETVKKPEGKRVAMPVEKQPAKYLSEILSDYDDPEKLRRAILHYEILGKPISLREPSEHIGGF